MAMAGLSDYKLIKDPIHGSIQLHPLLMKIINTRSFNRLKYIRQLGGLFYVYPGATHTRFEHSIGVCHLAGEYARMLQRSHQKLKISEVEILHVEIAGLCHDLGHGPFSHLFDSKVLNNLTTSPRTLRHEDLSRKILQHIFEFELKEEPEYIKLKDKINLEKIKDMIDPDRHEVYLDDERGSRKFLYEIVANKSTGIDVDKWDYFIRDCHYMGLQCEFDYKRLMQLSCIEQDPKTRALRICYSKKEADNILGMFRTRASLHQKAYRHKTVIAVEHQLSTAMLAVRDLPLIYSARRSKKISMADVFEDLLEEKPAFDGYLALTDGIIDVLLNMDPNSLDGGEEEKKLNQAHNSVQALYGREIFHLLDTTAEEKEQLFGSENFHDILQKVVAEAVNTHMEDIKTKVQEKLIGKTFKEAHKEFCITWKPPQRRCDMVEDSSPEDLTHLLKFYNKNEEYTHSYVIVKLFEHKMKEKMKDTEMMKAIESGYLDQCQDKLEKIVNHYFYDVVLLMLPHIFSFQSNKLLKKHPSSQGSVATLGSEVAQGSEAEELKLGEFFFEKVKISYESEKNGAEGPLVNSELLVFKKDDTNVEHLTTVNLLFAPKKYELTDVWMYCQKPKLQDQRQQIIKALKEMLNRWSVNNVS